jgi:TP901 family phage tail tape measure protein
MPSVVIDVEARVAQALDNLERVGQAGADAAKKMNAAFSVAKASIVGLVSAVSVDALVGKFNDAVSSLAKLDDAAEMTGASVESLSSILNTLKPSGIGLDQITDVAGKLTRAMQGADEETGKAAKAFEALGIETRDTAGNLRPVDEVLKDLADSLSGYSGVREFLDGAQHLAALSGSL